MKNFEKDVETDRLEEKYEEYIKEEKVVEDYQQENNFSKGGNNQRGSFLEDLKNKTESVGFLNDYLFVLRNWFSNNPLSVFSRKYTLISALFMSGIYFFINLILTNSQIGSIFNTIARFWISGYYFNSILSPDEPSVAIFMLLIIINLFFYLATILGIMITAKIIRTPDSSFKSSFEMLSIILVQSTAFKLLGFILSFIYSPLGYILMGISSIAFLLGMYLGIQKYLGRPQSSPFWVFSICMVLVFAVTCLILFLILYLFIRGFINSYIY